MSTNIKMLTINEIGNMNTDRLIELYNQGYRVSGDPRIKSLDTTTDYITYGAKIYAGKC